MAILLSSASGKMVETNKATLQRLARDNGDRLEFFRKAGGEFVSLNGRDVGELFESHEAAIKFLAKRRPVRMVGLPAARVKQIERMASAKRNPAMTHNKIRQALVRRYSNVKRSSTGIWTVTDPTAGTILARRKTKIIGRDDEAQSAAELYQR